MPFNYKTDSRLILRVDEDSPAYTDVAGTIAATSPGQGMANVQDADARGYTFTTKSGLVAPQWKVIGGKRAMTGTGSTGFGLTCPRSAISTGTNSIEAIINALRANQNVGSCTILVAYQLATAAAANGGNAALFSKGILNSTSLMVKAVQGTFSNQIPPALVSYCQAIDYQDTQGDAIPFGKVMVAGIGMTMGGVEQYKNGVPYIKASRSPTADYTGNLNIGCTDDAGHSCMGDILGVWIYGSATSTNSALSDVEHFDAYQQILANFGQPDPWVTATNKRVFLVDSFSSQNSLAGEHIRHLAMQSAPPAIYAISLLYIIGIPILAPLINHLQSLYGGIRVSMQSGITLLSSTNGPNSKTASMIAQLEHDFRVSIHANCPGVGLDTRSTQGRAKGGPYNPSSSYVTHTEGVRELFDPACAAYAALDGDHYTDIRAMPPLDDSSRFSNLYTSDTLQLTRAGSQAVARAEAMGLNAGPTAVAYTAAFEVVSTNVGNRVRLLLQAVGVPASPITVTVTLSGSAASMPSVTAVLRSAEVVPLFVDPSAVGTITANLTHAGGGAGVTSDPAMINLTVVIGAANQVVIPEMVDLLGTGPYLPKMMTVGQDVTIPVWLNGLATGTVTITQATVVGNFGGTSTKVLNYDGTLATVRQSITFTPTVAGYTVFISSNTIASQDTVNPSTVTVNAAPTILYMFCDNAYAVFEAAAGRPTSKIWLYLDAMAEGIVTLSDGGAGGTFSSGTTVAVHYEPMNGQANGLPVPVTYTPPAGAVVGSTITISATCVVVGATIAAPPTLAVIVTAVPTTYAITAPVPASGTVGIASDLWAIKPSTGAATGYVMLSDPGCRTRAICFNSSSQVQNFRLTPAAVGTISVTGTNTAGLIDPAGVSFVATIITKIFNTFRRRRNC